MSELDLSVNLAGVTLKNPVLTASGTFGSGKEYREFFDISTLGGIVTKGVSHEPWLGNPTPRVAETYGGMLNAIGLQNKGSKIFIEEDVPFLEALDTVSIVNLCGKTIEEYEQVARDFRDTNIDMYELNISCPNVKEGGMAFGTDPKMVEQVVSRVKAIVKKPLIVKLSPNVTDITEIAKAAQASGADALSLINTISGMQIDIHKRKPSLGIKVGGLSGPAVKPVAVAMVYKVSQAVDIPIIGMGGIQSGEDAIEFIMAGATAVAVGTANFVNPFASLEILAGITEFLKENNIKNLEDIRGCIK